MESIKSDGIKKKTIMIILDGLDYSYIKDNLGHFTLFRSLYEKKQLGPLESVVPADSIPSWISIYTGLNPAEHGVIESIDYLDFKNKVKGDYSVIKDRTIWDKLGKAGKKVFVFNPFMAYPATDINGLMICGPVFEGGEISTNHPEKVDIKTIPPLGGLVDHPTDKSMPKFLEDTFDLTKRQFDCFHKYFKSDNYDFAFLGILTSDRLQHFLWKYSDKTDRCHKKNNKLENAILNTYRLMEKNVGVIIQEYGDQYNIIVLSDHGHGRRCQKTFYVNQWLINNGFIKNKSKKKRLLEYIKNMTLLILSKMKFVQTGTGLLKKIKVLYKVKNSDYVFKKNSKIYAPKFDGTNPFGGICIEKQECSSNQEYEEIRTKIISGLMKTQDNGKSIMHWAKRREDIYLGEKIEQYPDIVYCMDSDYGVDRGLFGNRLFGINAFHEVISGGHKLEGVIMGNTKDISNITSVLDICDYVLRSVTEGNSDYEK